MPTPPRQRREADPLFRREMRERWRRPLTPLQLALFAFLMAWLAYQFYGAMVPVGETQTATVNGSGREFFLAVSRLHLLAWIPGGMLLAAPTLAAERERGHLSDWVLAGLTPDLIVRAKFRALAGYALVLACVPFPILALCFPLGGVAPGELAATGVLTVVVALNSVALGMMISASSARVAKAMGGALLAGTLMLAVGGPVLALVVAAKWPGILAMALLLAVGPVVWVEFARDNFAGEVQRQISGDIDLLLPLNVVRERAPAVHHASVLLSETPKSQSWAPNSESLAPDPEILAPDSQNLAPKSESWAPNSENLAANPGFAAQIADLPPKSESLAPNSENLAPTEQSLAPTTPSLAPKSENLAPNSEILAPKSEILAPVAPSLAPTAPSLAPITTFRAPLAPLRESSAFTQTERKLLELAAGNAVAHRDLLGCLTRRAPIEDAQAASIGWQTWLHLWICVGAAGVALQFLASEIAMLQILVKVVFGLAMAQTALLAAPGFTRERAQRMLSALQLTALSSRDIVIGKIGAALLGCAHFFIGPLLALCLMALYFGPRSALMVALTGALGVILTATGTVTLSLWSRKTEIVIGGALVAVLAVWWLVPTVYSLTDIIRAPRLLQLLWVGPMMAFSNAQSDWEMALALGQIAVLCALATLILGALCVRELNKTRAEDESDSWLQRDLSRHWH